MIYSSNLVRTVCIWVEYEAECTHCKAKTKLQYHPEGGWEEGKLIPKDPTDSKAGRCPKCLRHSLKITKKPKAQIPCSPPEGFVRVPSR